jgi:peptide/nickel transport system substrate-binding protein
MNDHKQLDDFFGLNTNDEEQNIKKIITQEKQKKLKFYLIPKVLSKRERYVIGFFLLVILGSILAIPFTTYVHFTKEVPAYGGKFTEGIVYEPRYINPLLQTNDTDRDLVSIIYSSLLKYNVEGQIVPDLAQSYDISSDGLNYTIYLKDNVFWHDGKKLTADDVIYTIQTAQNPDYGSPQRINWQGVQVEKINDLTLVFKLQTKYAQFINNLTIKIMPKHIWENIKPINFALSEINLKPIGSGPYKFEQLKKDKNGRIQSYLLSANKKYYGGTSSDNKNRPFIDKIELKFYSSEEEMINAYNRNEIEGLSFISPDNLKKVKYKQRLNLRELQIPRYFAIFFNQNKSNVLSDKNVRLALNFATNREDLLNKVLEGKGIKIYSPLATDILNVPVIFSKNDYNPEEAKNILEKSGWTKNENNIFKKGNQELSLKITTSTFPELSKVANIIKEQWEALGAKVSIETLSTSELQQLIRDRNYEALLFGTIMNINPDPFSLWHSSQKKDPGLNLSLYDNKNVDTLLEEARQTLNPLERTEKYNNFQKLVIEDMPAIFLYNPFYIHGLPKKIKGSDGKLISTPSDRFNNIENWYIKTKRVWK